MKCEICDKEIGRKDNYDRHLLSKLHKINIKRKKPEIEIFNCHICNFACDKQSKYDRHLITEKHKINSGQKNKEETKYKCDLCEYETKRKNDIEKHNLIHTKKKYECGKCDKKYKNEDDLIIHRKTQFHRKRCFEEKGTLTGQLNRIKKDYMAANKIIWQDNFKWSHIIDETIQNQVTQLNKKLIEVNKEIIYNNSL